MDTLNANWQLIELFVVFILLTILEGFCGHNKYKASDIRKSYFANIGTFIFNDFLMSVASVSSLLVVADQYSHFGLLNFIPNATIKAIVSFLILDFALYAWHWVCHNVDFLWLFHRVHHSDPCMNVTTTFRVHVVEILLITMVKLALILALGMSSDLILLNEAFILLTSMFHHANISFDQEKLLSKLFIMPYQHRTHHSCNRTEHDSNYGAVFSIWDQLFGTDLNKVPKKIGLHNIRNMNMAELIKYGLIVDWVPSTPTLPANYYKMVEEAAYYKAMARGFQHGNDWDDWLTAEEEIKQQLSPKKNRILDIICLG